MSRFRITASPSTRPDVVLVRVFHEDRKDADEHYRQLQSDDTILCDAGYIAYIIAMDELSNGEWTNVNTAIVSCRGGE